MKNLWAFLLIFLSSCFYDPITGIDYLIVNNLKDKLTIRVISNDKKDSLFVHEIPSGESKIVLKDEKMDYAADFYKEQMISFKELEIYLNDTLLQKDWMKRREWEYRKDNKHHVTYTLKVH